MNSQVNILEEKQKELKQLTDIINEAHEGSYIASDTHKKVKRGIILSSFLSGIVLGFSQGKGYSVNIPLAASLTTIGMKTVYDFQMYVMGTNLTREYIESKREIIKDKERIRELYEKKIENLNQHQKNNLDLVQKTMYQNNITKQVNIGDFIFQDYFKSYQSGNQERMDKILNAIARDGLVIDKLKLNPIGETMFYIVHHPKTKYVVSGFGTLISSIAAGAGYGVGQGIAHFT